MISGAFRVTRDREAGATSRGTRRVLMSRSEDGARVMHNINCTVELLGQAGQRKAFTGNRASDAREDKLPP